MAAARPELVIESELKKLRPPSIISSVLCDQANAKTLCKIYHTLKDKRDETHVEPLAHLILLSSRLHNAGIEGALQPLVKKLPEGGGSMSQKMSAALLKVEESLASADKSKKHLDNEDFINAMKELESALDEAFELERSALVATIAASLAEDELIDAATRMEEAKNNATLKHGTLSYA